MGTWWGAGTGAGGCLADTGCSRREEMVLETAVAVTQCCECEATESYTSKWLQ